MLEPSKNDPSPQLALNHLFRWQFIGSVYMSFLQVAGMVLLGQFLGYKELGIFTIFQLIFRFGTSVLDPGMYVSIIQKTGYHQELIRRQSKIQNLILLTGLIVLLGFFTWESDYWTNNFLIVCLSLLLFTIIGRCSLFPSLLTHHLMQKEISLAQMAGATLEFAFLFSTIWFWDPVFVFCAGFVLRFSLYYFLCYFQSLKLQARFETIVDIDEHIRFSSYQVLNQGLGFVQGNFDTVLVGSVFGLTLLGPYHLASELSYLLFSKINPVFNKAIFPVLAKFRNDHANRQKIILESLVSHALVTLSLYYLLYHHVDNLIALAFKDPEGKILLFSKYILIMAMIRSVNNLIFSDLLAMGESKNLLRWNISVLVFNYAFIAIIYLTQISMERFLFLNIFVSLGVLIFSVLKLMNYLDSPGALWVTVLRFLVYSASVLALLNQIKSFDWSLPISLVCGILIIAMLSLTFYYKKARELVRLKII